ncbi:MAG TPA: type II secretion system protein GspM [Sphingobium sp.]
MVESFKNWWSKHSVAERWLIAVLALAMAVIFLWLAVWRPVTDGLETGWARQGAALDRYGSVNAKVAALKNAPAAPQRSGVPLEQLVSQSATEAGFTLDRVGSSGGGMSVSIASARTGPLLTWLSQIEAGGVAIQSISIVPGQTPGTVAMQAVFQDRGA